MTIIAQPQFLKWRPYTDPQAMELKVADAQKPLTGLRHLAGSELKTEEEHQNI